MLLNFYCKLIWIAVINLLNNQNSTLTINISNAIPLKGKILVAIYNNEEGFPSNSKQCFKYANGQVSENGISLITIPDLPVGNYAISVFQDENNDGILNTNFMGIPKEGYGFSNNAHNPFGPPEFKDCVIKHQNESRISIKLKRW